MSHEDVCDFIMAPVVVTRLFVIWRRRPSGFSVWHARDRAMKIVTVAGARPNFVKIAPLLREMRRHPSLVPLLVHTGQHYDGALSDQLLTDLEIPPPEFNLGVGSCSHATQTAEVIRRMEPILE